MILLSEGAAMTAEVERILRAASDEPFVFSLDHGIDKATPPDHVAAPVDQVKGSRLPVEP